MQNITIGRYDNDPEAQGCIKPEDGRWQLVIDKDGYPHLYVESTLEEDDGTKVKGMFLVEDMLPEGMTVRDLMDGGCFGGKLSPEEEAEAQLEYEKSRAVSGIPCPR
jgi:hypothetical protein